MLDLGSSLANRILGENPSAYQSLVVTGPTPEPAIELLRNVKAEQLPAQPVKSQGYADAMLAGLWLWHDGLEECHHIAQASRPTPGETTTMAFWHAIMHRREGDFSNSKYWYARAADHAALASIASRAAPLVNRAPADKSLLRLIATGWNPNAFVDFVESISPSEADPRYPLAVELQQLEWHALWEYCARHA